MTLQASIKRVLNNSAASSLRPYCRGPVGSTALLLASASLFSSTASADTASSGDTLEEVVVSATRRDTSIQDIPYSISAISAATLEDNHVQSLSDLSRSIAGVTFVDQGPASRSNIILRGLNTSASNQTNGNTVAPVSTYIGETPLFLPLQLSDLERVEVLRGPQGTLYGSGSLAGTIRFIPKDPDLTGFHAEINTDVAAVDETNKLNYGATGMVNIPINDVMAFRIAAQTQHYAGFIDENYIVKLGPPSTAIDSPVGIPVSADPKNPIFGPLAFSPKPNANDDEIWHVRGSFLFKPNDQFSVRIAYFHQETNTEGVQADSPNFGGSVDTPPSQNPFYSPSYPVSFPTGGVVFPHNQEYDANNSFVLESHRKTDLESADLTYDLGFASLSSSSSYYTDRGNAVNDGTGLLTLYPTFYGFIPRLVDYETSADKTNGVTQEFRLVSKVGEKFDYVVGLFYQHLMTDSDEYQFVPGQTYYGTMVGDPGYGNDINVISSTETDFKDRAIFGEFTWHMTDKWQITGGIRQFWQSYFLNTSTAFPFCGYACSNEDDALGTTASQGGYKVENHIFKANTSYKITDDLNVYFNFAEGFRRGGSNGIPVSGPFAANPALLVYTPDKTKNFEVGAKGTAAGITYSAALFYIDWDNFQVNATTIASGEGIAVNGPKARSAGVEFEIAGEIIPRFTYDLGYSFSDATVAQNFSVYDYTTSHNLVAIVTGKDGDQLPNSPKQSITLALDFTQNAPLLDGWDLRWHVNSSYRSATLSQLTSANPQAPPPFKIAGFSIWDGSINLADRKGFTASLYIQNMFNALGVTGGSDAGSVGIRGENFFVARPRTAGFNLGYKF